jgi:spore maturation protein CgeB
VVTNAKSALPKYEGIGYRNVIYAQWACNHFLYRKLDYPRIYDVTFVGQAHGNRRQIIDELRKNGIYIKTWGVGWKNGRLSQVEMIKVFNQSKINLNLSKASVGEIDEVKLRDVEIPGCGGFIITGAPKDEISQYYDIGKEIVCYESTQDLIDKVTYYLNHDDEREAIAEAGYIKTIDKHTYERRFTDIFGKIGLLD